MKVFTLKFICNNLYLFFVIFIIYLQSFTKKVFSTTGTSHWMTDWSIQLMTEVTFAGKYPWLMYIMINLTCCFHFFQWQQHFFLMSLLVFSNSSKILIVPIPSCPFPSLNWVSNLGHSLTYGNCAAIHTTK